MDCGMSRIFSILLIDTMSLFLDSQVSGLKFSIRFGEIFSGFVIVPDGLMAPDL